VRSLVFSADGQMLASAAVDPTTVENGTTLRIFSVGAAKELIRVPLAETPLYIGFQP